MREADLYPALKRHFEALGFRIYAEMPAPHGGYFDLLALREQESVGVELKAFFSRVAVRQAGRNKRYLWQSYVAVPKSARIPAARRAALKRRGAGLLLVESQDVLTLVEARREAPPFSVGELFGRYLTGELAAAYEAATGGVPTEERISAFQLFLEKLKVSLEARGGFASTDQLRADTLGCNYFRHPTGGLRWILERHFRRLAPDLWALPGAPLPRPICYTLPVESLVRTSLPGTFVCLPPPGNLPRTGDLVKLMRGGKLQRRARVIFAERHEIVETPQRELRAGPAVFFPWRCPQLKLPAETLVIRLA